MATQIIRGTNNKPGASEMLAKCFAKQNRQGVLYFGYPVMNTPEGAFALDALWISRDKGLVAFDLVDGTDVGDYMTRQDAAANRLDSKLRQHSDLVRKRNLLVDINVITVVASLPVA